MADIHN